MNFLSKLLRGIAFIPAIVSGVEGFFGAKAGEQKKQAALSFVEAALSATQAVAEREIVDPGKFRDGLGQIIDGTVACLNASSWGKTK